LPLPVVGHISLLDRLTALVTSHRLPSSGASGERTAGLLGGGGIAAKAATAGTTILVAGAGVVGLTTGVRSSGSHRPRHVSHEHVQEVRPAATLIAAPPAMYPRAAAASRAGDGSPRHLRGLTSHMSREARAAVTNFPGLGGNSPTPSATNSRAGINPPRVLNERERILKTP
jgi:hypothetical protein